jgi:NADPH-dependent ferric siderophore reductase
VALKEVCIASRTFGPGRAQEGDVIGIRDPKPSIGTKEGTHFLWLLIDESRLPTGDLVQIEPGQPKYRYNISLGDLKMRNPQIDLARLRDPDDWYQPFRDTDRQTGLHRANLTTNAAPTDKRVR